MYRSIICAVGQIVIFKKAGIFPGNIYYLGYLLQQKIHWLDIGRDKVSELNFRISVGTLFRQVNIPFLKFLIILFISSL